MSIRFHLFHCTVAETVESCRLFSIASNIPAIRKLSSFPAAKRHPVGTARVLVAALVLIAVYGAKELRKRICQSLLSKLYDKITSRWLYVYQDSQITNDWKYYTSEVTGKGNTGDDVIWTLVRWPSLRPIDSFKIAGGVGMIAGIHESQAKLEGRWRISQDPDRPGTGPVPARGFRSKFLRAAVKALQFLESI